MGNTTSAISLRGVSTATVADLLAKENAAFAPYAEVSTCTILTSTMLYMIVSYNLSLFFSFFQQTLETLSRRLILVARRWRLSHVVGFRQGRRRRGLEEPVGYARRQPEFCTQIIGSLGSSCSSNGTRVVLYNYNNPTIVSISSFGRQVWCHYPRDNDKGELGRQK